MTTFNPATGKLERESVTRAEMVRDSIREYQASRADIIADFGWPWCRDYKASIMVAEIDRAIATLERVLTKLEAPDCPRTLCIWNAGTPISGFKCSYAYSGAIPCTGAQRCHTCGEFR